MLPDWSVIAVGGSVGEFVVRISYFGRGPVGLAGFEWVVAVECPLVGAGQM